MNIDNYFFKVFAKRPRQGQAPLELELVLDLGTPGGANALQEFVNIRPLRPRGLVRGSKF